jgi:hypothetical protein
MHRTIGIAAAVALTTTAIAAWTSASIRSDAALKTLGPMATEAQIDVPELTKTARTLPTETFDSF